MSFVVHWDEVEREEADLGVVAGAWRELGTAAGSVGIELCRIEVPTRRQATPQHAEDEELFVALGGSGWSVQEDGCFAIAAGDAILYTAWHPAHTVVAGDDGLDVLAFGLRWVPAALRFPRLAAVKVGDLLVEGSSVHQWGRETAIGLVEVRDPPDPRPPTIGRIADMPLSHSSTGTAIRDIGRTLGSRPTGLRQVEMEPGQASAKLHCHSAEEELLVVLAGSGTLELGAERSEVRAGHVVARPPGTGVAHRFTAGEEGMTLLAYGTRIPDDVVLYPEHGELWLRGVDVRLPVPPAG